MKNELRFFWNGIKVGKGKLQKAFFHGGGKGEYLNYPDGTISIYVSDYTRFSAEICAAFTIKNDTDIITDYIEGYRIYVTPAHPLYPQVRSALDASKARYQMEVA